MGCRINYFLIYELIMGGEEVRSEDLFWVELKIPKKKHKA
jgi:hypothetical protein